MSFSSIGIGLVASRSLRKGENSPLVDLVRTFAPLFTEVMEARIVAVGGAYDALRLHDALPGHEAIERLPNGYLGGLVRLVARVVDRNPGRALDMVIYLTDPTDPTSLYPEALALQRECVVHGIPFFSTAASAAEWLTLKWAGAVRHDPSAISTEDLARLVATHVRPDEMASETVALIAHDSRKWELMRFVADHHQLLSMFGRRVATGTTGGLLNGEHQRSARRPTPSAFPRRPSCPWSAACVILRRRWEVKRGRRDGGAAHWAVTPRSPRKFSTVVVVALSFSKIRMSPGSTKPTSSSSNAPR